MARKSIKLHELQEAAKSRKPSEEKKVIEGWRRLAEKQQDAQDEEATAGLLLTSV